MPLANIDSVVVFGRCLADARPTSTASDSAHHWLQSFIRNNLAKLFASFLRPHLQFFCRLGVDAANPPAFFAVSAQQIARSTFFSAIEENLPSGT